MNPRDDDFQVFFHAVRPRMRAVVARFRIPPEDAEDVLQQAFLTLLHRWQQVQDPEAWLLAVVRNKCLVYRRDKGRQLHQAVDEEILEWLAGTERPVQEKRATRRDVEQLVAKLKPRCQELIHLRYKMGYDLAEVADELGYQRSSVSKVTLRCLSALSRQMVIAGFCPPGAPQIGSP